MLRGDGMKYALAYNEFHNLESIGIDGKTEKLIQYTYKNGNGRLKEMTYANGDTMKATYNSIGQMVSEKWFDSTENLTAHYKYSYDGEGNIIRSIDILANREYNYEYEEGRIVRATEANITLSGEVITYRGIINTVRYYYDTEGKMTKKVITFVNGSKHTVYHENNDDSAVVKFTVGGKTVTSHSKTDSFGRKTFDELQLGTGFVSREFSYCTGAVTQEHIDAEKCKSSPTTQLVSRIVLTGGRTLDYEYDAEERITKVTDSVDGITEYTYDALGQLLTETKDDEVVNTMMYDNYGNITKKNDTDYIYGKYYPDDDFTQEPILLPWKDLLTYHNGVRIDYDDQGNPTSYLGSTLTWEKGRQLKSYDNNTYTYNANGIRTSKTVNGIKHKYTLDGTKILRETWDSNTLIPLYDNEDSVCGIIYNDVPYYFIKNLQGDVIEIVTSIDKELVTVAKYSYDAWGVYTVTKDSVGIATINPFRYRGYYYDEEIGLYYLQSRYYNPRICRFINSDDYMYTQTSFSGKNLFAYCDNNAINRLDSEGHWWRVILLLVAVTIVISGCSKKTEEVKKSVKYSVPLYNQGNLNLCWAYCQVMIESYQNGKTLKKKEADERAKEIAIARHGETDWNKGGWPSNSGEERDIDTIETLYNILLNSGPVYGLYKSSDSGHLIVVTGVDVNKNRVYTNNPWGVKGKQTFEKFKKGVAKRFYHSGKNLVFKHIYLVKS